MMFLYAVSGRLPGEDADVFQTVAAPTMDEAQGKFCEALGGESAIFSATEEIGEFMPNGLLKITSMFMVTLGVHVAAKPRSCETHNMCLAA